MQPSAVLSVLVTAEGVGPTNAKLNSVQSTLQKTAATGNAVGSSMSKAGTRIEKAGTTITKFGKGAKKWVADPLLLAAGAATAFGYSFEKSMLLVQTHTDTSTKNLQLYKREILAMSSSGRYTQGPKELGEAMYHIASDGYQGAKAIEMLKSSADLATVGQSNLAETTYAVVSAVKNQIRGAEDGTEAIAAMNAIMGAGDTKMNEVTGSMSTGIIPAAKQMGLSFQDVGAALDLLTQRGVPAQQGAYRLAMTFQMLIPHTEKAEDQFKSLGLSNLELVETIEKEPKMGLLHAMELLEERLEKVYGKKPSHQIQAIEEIFGGGRTSRGAISMLQNLKQLDGTYQHIFKLEKETPKKIQEAKANDVNKLKESWVQFEAVLTEVGIILLPAVTKGFQSLVKPVIGAVQWFSHLNPEVQHWLILMGAGAIALAYMARLFGPLITGIGKMIGWFGKMITASEGVVGGEEAKQAAYEATATVAQTSAAEQVAAIQEVVDAEKVAQAERTLQLPVGGLSGQQTMNDLMPAAGITTKASTVAEDAGQLSLLGAPAAETAGAGAVGASMLPEMEAAGAAAAPEFATAFAAALPIAIPAAIGIGAAAIFGPKIIDSIFGSGDTHHTNRLKKSTEEAAETAMESSHRQLRASHTLTKASHTTKQAQTAVQNVNKRLTSSQEDLNQATHKYGKNSQQAAEAAKRLKNIKQESIAITRKLGDAEKVDSVARTAVMRADKTAIANMRTKKTRLVEEMQLLHERLGIIEKEPASEERTHKESAKLRELREVGKQIKVVKEEEQKLFQGASTQVGSKFSKYLEKINPQVYNLKKAAHAAGEGVKQYLNTTAESFTKGGHSLEFIITKQKNFKTETEKVGQTIDGPFKTKAAEGFAVAAISAANAEQATVKAFTNIGAETNKMMTALGGKPLNFGTHAEKGSKATKTAKKARGGEISIGAAVGDSVPALLEKGEYVVNREAVKAVGVHKLNELNFGQAARFQEGGAVGGNMGEAIAEANRINAEEFPYKWGGGHGGFEGPYDCSGSVSAVLHAAGLLPKPMVSGELASYGAPGPGPITIYANGVHAFMSIMGKFFGTSESNPGGGAGWFPSSLGLGEATAGDSGGSFAVRHPTGVIAETLAKNVITGPEGALKQIGQGSVNKVEAAANAYVEKHMPGGFGGGDANLEGLAGSGPVMAKMGNILLGHGFNKIGASGPIGNAYRESKLNPASVGTGGGGLFGFTTPPISLANLKEYAAKVGTAWTDVEMQMDFMLNNGGMGMKGIVNAAQTPGESARLFMEDWEHPGIAALSEREEGARMAYAAGYSKGGPVTKAGETASKTAKAGKTPPIEKQIKSTLHGLAEGKHLPKFNAQLKKVGRRIGKLDLAQSQEEALGGLTNEVEKWAEFASNASSMTTSVEVENPETHEEESQIVQGIFKGGGEASWLEKELQSLLALRSQVIASHETLDKKTIPRIMQLLKHTQERLRAAQKAIREDENDKREMERKIKEVEKHQTEKVREIEKEEGELEHKINNLQNAEQKLQQAKKPDQQALGAVRKEIKEAKEAIGDKKHQVANVNSNAHDEVKKDHEKVHDIEKDLQREKRVEAGAQTLVEELEERKTSMYSTMSNLYTNGGEFEGTGLSFFGLAQIQGKGTTTEAIPNPPEFGSVGGEIFSVQARLRQITEEAEQKGKQKTPTPDQGETELEALEKQLGTEYRKRYQISQAQYKVLQDFPSVGSVGSVPYAGAYAIGGNLVAATVGERGREVAIMPTGSRVVPEHDAKEAIARMGGGGSPTINFEEIHFHEAENRVSGRMNGQDFDQEVEQVNRKQSRRSAPNTPGGRRRR